MSLSSNEMMILAIMFAIFAGIAASAARISHAKRKSRQEAEEKRAAFKAAPPRQDTLDQIAGKKAASGQSADTKAAVRESVGGDSEEDWLSDNEDVV